MKKLCALILTLVMVLSLAAPAMAADQTLWQELGYTSQQDLLDSTGLSAANYETLAAKAASFDAKAYYAANEQEFWGMTAQEYMTDYGMTEEEFRQEMLSYWFSEEYMALLSKQTIDNAITAAGGVVGRPNVMWNGKCIQFTDAAPELTNNRTMVPIRAIMEDLGAEVTYENRTVTCTLNGTTISFEIGATEAGVKKGADVAVVVMDSPSYIKNNRTYVPLRFISEASGYDVFWDNAARTAVIVDREAIIASLNENLTILNDMLHKQYAQYDLSKAYEIDYNLGGTVSLIDTINGNKNYNVGADMTVLWKGTDYEVNGSLKLGDVIDALMETGEVSQDEIPAQALSMLKNLDFSMILSSEGYWISAPILTYALAEQYPEMSGKDVWLDVGAALGVDMSELMETSAALMTENATIGSILYDSSVMSMEMLSDMGQLSYFSLAQSLGFTKTTLDTLMGDSTFTKSGTSYKWSMDRADLVKLAAAMGVPLTEADLEGLDFSVEMTIRQNGSVDYDMRLTLTDSTSGAVATLTLSGTSGALSGDMDLRLQVKNMVDAKITLDYSGRVTTKTPAKNPPAGATILDGSSL